MEPGPSLVKLDTGLRSAQPGPAACRIRCIQNVSTRGARRLLFARTQRPRVDLWPAATSVVDSKLSWPWFVEGSQFGLLARSHAVQTSSRLHTLTVSISTELGERRIVEVPAGSIEYRERGTGPAIVFVHGVGANGDLWRGVAPLLASGYRCIAPDLPWGSHSIPLRPGADLSLPGMAGITADFLNALGLEDVTVVANDTGGAVSQVLVGSNPERVGRLVLTSCDAFEKFPPTPQKYLEFVARSRALIWLVAKTLRFKLVQRLPTAYGFATSRPMPADIMRSFTIPMRTNPGVRHDIRRMLRAVDTRYTFEAAERLHTFAGPALVLWAENDKIFPREHGRRLAALLPNGEFELITNCRTFIPEEQPEDLAQRIRAWLQEHKPPAIQRHQ